MAASSELVLVETEVDRIPKIVERVRAGFNTHKTREYDYRVTQLRNLMKLIEENEKQILAALKADLNKCETEAHTMEYNQVHGDIIECLNNLSNWMSPQHKPRDLLNKFNSVYVQAEPFGLMLNMAPWNYPFQLNFCALVGTIAAGNACVMKPSESAVATSNLIAELVPRYLDQECYAVVTGGLEVARAVLKERYDFIVYTGSTPVGKLVMKEAATHLTPVLLELGGKSPAIVAGDANLEVSGRRIAWGKFLNAGQTCIAPDYVLCMRDQQDKLVEVCKKTIQEFYGENPKESPDYGRIINARHFKRLVGLIEESKGTVAYGGDTDEQTRYIQPTLVANAAPDEKLMQEEIFGPVLPFVAVDTLDEAIEFVNSREKPLAMYVFTGSKSTFEKVNNLTSAGGVCHNDTMMHGGITELPFGGVGHSGCGAYRGKHSFDCFSHWKGVMATGTGMEGLNKMRYPPFSPTKLSRLKWLMSKTEKSRGWLSWRLIMLFLFVAILAVMAQMYGIPAWPFMR